jgi:preprotein translocase subunit Sss1
MTNMRDVSDATMRPPEDEYLKTALGVLALAMVRL